MMPRVPVSIFNSYTVFLFFFNFSIGKNAQHPTILLTIDCHDLLLVAASHALAAPSRCGCTSFLNMCPNMFLNGIPKHVPKYISERVPKLVPKLPLNLLGAFFLKPSKEKSNLGIFYSLFAKMKVSEWISPFRILHPANSGEV